MPISAGIRLGRYEILSLIGAGGMGDFRLSAATPAVDAVTYSSQGGPVIRRKDHERQLTARKVLLIPDILVASEQQVKLRLLSRV